MRPVGLGFTIGEFECSDCKREETVVVKRGQDALDRMTE
jgi:hypothetical protein